MSPKSVVIFDIDGTMANIDHRRRVLKDNPKNWNEFFLNMGEDVPIEPIVNLYRLIFHSELYECIVVSGRSEQYRDITEQWFVWNGIPFGRMILRANQDTRPDHIIKEEILDRLIHEGKTISLVVDDRRSVVNMWRRRGIICLQCDDFEE